MSNSEKEPPICGGDISPVDPITAAQLDELTKVVFPHYPGRQQIEQFFSTLGRAISVWQLVETALYEVYERAIGPSRPGAAGASFHALQAFNVKLTATDAAIKFAIYGDQTALDEWDHIFKCANKMARRRNEFVHFSTVVMYNEEPPNEKVRLEPQIYDYRHIGRRPMLRVSDITEITERFVQLQNELGRFKERIPEVHHRRNKDTD